MIPDVKLQTPLGVDKVLLHTCCAPCSSAIVECLVRNGITPVIFYSNDNIYPREEFDKREGECLRYARSLGLEVIEDEYDHDRWLPLAAGLEGAPERGARCLECFRYRLLRAARYASAHGYKVLTTTLASSRWKSLEQIDEAGRWACAQVEGVLWWDRNWRKDGLQQRRSEIIREQQFYNQTYCGCEFSLTSHGAENGKKR